MSGGELCLPVLMHWKFWKRFEKMGKTASNEGMQGRAYEFLDNHFARKRMKSESRNRARL